MRLLLGVSVLVATLGGLGCAADLPPPVKAPQVEPWDVPLTAPDEPPPSEARPKLTSSVTIGETAPGVPAGHPVGSQQQGAAFQGGPSPTTTPTPSSTSWTRRDLFAEDRANQGRVVGSNYRGYYRYGRQPMHVNNGGPVVSAPRGTPAVGGNWPAARSFGTPAVRSRVH